MIKCEFERIRLEMRRTLMQIRMQHYVKNTNERDVLCNVSS